MMADIRITCGESGTLYVRPASRLGDRFEEFRRLCRVCDLQWVKGSSANTGPAEALTRIIEKMEEGGFTVELGPDVVAMMGRRLNKADEAALRARAKMDYIEQVSGQRYRDYQRQDIEFMWRASEEYQAGINANEMRTGKTPELCCLFEERGLVVTPKAGIEVWEAHVKAWTPWLTPIRIHHRMNFRWPGPNEVLITHYECLPARRIEGGGGPYCDDLYHQCPRKILLIFDEAHYIMTPTSARTKRARMLIRAVQAQQGTCWQATGTPAPNRPRIELWNMLENVGLGTKLWGTKKAFVSDLDAFDQDRTSGRLSKAMVRRMRRDVIAQIPKRTDERIRLRLDGDAMAQRTQLDLMWARIKERGLDHNADALLRAFRDDPEFSNYSAIRAALAAAKIPAMLATVEEWEAEEQPFIIISAHRAPIEALKSVRDCRTFMGGDTDKRRTEAIRGFQEGKFSKLGFTIGSGGVAIDLSMNGDQPVDAALVIDRSWRPGDNDQAEARIESVVNPRPKTYRYLEWDHPLELHVGKILDEKSANIGRTIDTVAGRCGDPDRTLADTRNLYDELRAKWGEDPVEATAYKPPEDLDKAMEGLTGLFSE